MTWAGNLNSPTKASSTSASATPLRLKKLVMGWTNASATSMRRCTVVAGRSGSAHSSVVTIGSSISAAMAR
ncbi:hypothetical protein G6F65_023456 [Rhizopus arrhizus]|nr:hypothetical protein G6F65_023456 [Rhizopus arrhizus]